MGYTSSNKNKPFRIVPVVWTETQHYNLLIAFLSSQCVKALVYYDVHSCRLDIGNEKGDTPLHIAARWGYQGIIEVLLQNGANPEIQNRMKETSLQCALNSKVFLFIFQPDFFLMQHHRGVDVHC